MLAHAQHQRHLGVSAGPSLSHPFCEADVVKAECWSLLVRPKNYVETQCPEGLTKGMTLGSVPGVGSLSGRSD
jgi:hypothetical protein